VFTGKKKKKKKRKEKRKNKKEKENIWAIGSNPSLYLYKV